MALVGLAALDKRLAAFQAPPRSFDDTIAHAAGLALGGAAADAARLIDEALAKAPDGNAGWLLPIEPLLRVHLQRTLWTAPLARLHARAT
jgi:hypothetical protein